MARLEEYIKTVRNWLEGHEINCSAMTDYQAIEGFLTIQHRLVEPKPRQVWFSEHLSQKNLEAEIKLGLDLLISKICIGKNVNGHLTRRVLDPNFTDKAFSDWGIQHLHLSGTPHRTNPRLFAGTEQVLFVAFEARDAYFIEVDSHTDPANHKYPFAERRLLQIIADEWPQLLESRRIPNALGLEAVVTKSEEIHKMRSFGINLFHMINGSSYMPTGGGISTAGTSVSIRKQMNEIASDF